MDEIDMSLVSPLHFCPVCPYTSPYSAHLKRHMLTHSDGAYLNDRSRSKLNVHSCSYCSYSSPLLGNLKRHMLTHSGLKPFQCSLCCLSFAQKCHMKRHMMTHWNEQL
ncbi:zinc finger protein 513-like [Uloborus diversus]|uniref:zinc finger protein 513-like n=1 Tax=Uloborus diversus TaxID=327109 RepID=UPI00240A1E84|nr:zinc finger protein 513-like [Uloborus diversus]